MTGKMPGAPKIQMPVVDVRDVAQAHLNGIKLPEAGNNRFALSAKVYWFRDILEVLNKEFGQRYKIKAKELPYCAVKFFGLFNGDARGMAKEWGT